MYLINCLVLLDMFLLEKRTSTRPLVCNIWVEALLVPRTDGVYLQPRHRTHVSKTLQDQCCFIPNTLRAPNYPLALGTNLWASSQYGLWVQ